MWGAGSIGERKIVVCIACGSSVTRSDAREYDKFGDRWKRKDKQFEYLCKECHRDLCHLPRDDLESLLIDVDAGKLSQMEFLEQYHTLVTDRYDSPEEREQ